MAQSTEFPLKKPAGFHWDCSSPFTSFLPRLSLLTPSLRRLLRSYPHPSSPVFLLGITTFLSGLLGIPAPNGLIPQAPAHTKSLLVMGFPSSPSSSSASSSSQPTVDGSRISEPSSAQQRGSNSKPNEKEESPNPNEKRDATTFVPRVEVPIAVIEQRVSNLAQGAACAVMMTGPFLKLLGWVPKGVLAGLFVSSKSLLPSFLFSSPLLLSLPINAQLTIIILSPSGSWDPMLCQAQASPTSSSTSSRIPSSSLRRNPFDASGLPESALGWHWSFWDSEQPSL